MLTRGFVLVVVATGVVLSIGGSWGIAALASSHNASVPTSTATAVAGHAGSNGKNGNDGKDGAAGIPGSNGTNGTAGSVGARGPAGAQGTAGADGTAGAQGLTGPQGPAGPSGASAPTFSATSAAGETVQILGNEYTFPAQTALVPAGPALVGFSVGLQNTFFTPLPISCSLVDANDTGTVFATTASIALGNPPAFSTFATTQVVNLTAPTSLAVECTSNPPSFVPFFDYEDLSVYAISFAP
jgi:hypothetical protein